MYLIRREGEDAGHIVMVRTAPLLAEVPDGVVAALVVLAQHVEEEGVDVVEERLVVEEIFGGSGGPEATFLDLLDTLEDDHY